MSNSKMEDIRSLACSLDCSSLNNDVNKRIQNYRCQPSSHLHTYPWHFSLPRSKTI